MSSATYTVTINRPLVELLNYLNEIDAEQVPAEGGLSFEAVRGGTRIYYTTSRGIAGFFNMADTLIAQISRKDRGKNVPELVFEP
jgi:hypothetical protein